MNDKEFKADLPEVGKFMDEYERVLDNAARFNMPQAIWAGNVLLSIDSGYNIPDITVGIAKLMIGSGCPFKGTQVPAVQSFTIPEDPKTADIMWNQSFAFIEKCSIAERSSGKRIEDEPLIFCIDITECIPEITSKEMHSRLATLLDIKGSFIYIFKVPYLEKSVLDRVGAVISDIFPVRVVAVEPLSDGKLALYLRHRLESMNVSVGRDADKMLKKLVESEKEDGRFDGLQTMNKLADSIIYTKLSKIRKEEKVSITGDELAEIYCEFNSGRRDPEIVLEKLYDSQDTGKAKKIGF